MSHDVDGPPPTVLVVDDEAELRGLVGEYLSHHGLVVRGAADAARARQAVAQCPPDLAILDIGMPGESGLSLAHWLRASQPRIGLLMLSAAGTPLDRVAGLEQGADDYLSKPFGLQELLARVKALLRRARGPQAGAGAQFGDVVADFAAGEVRRAGVRVEMTARDQQLLAFLVGREGRVVTRQAILDAVWGEDYFGTERTVDNFITRLRQKLDDPEEPRHFLTVRGMGYRYRGDQA